MIPVLFEVDEQLFNTNGLGRLSDAIQCTVTEERNGQFELYLQYPINGEHYEDIVHSRLIYAVPADGVGAKPFRIYRISKPMNGKVEVFAEHISYQLSQCIVKPFDATGINQVFAALKSNSVIAYPFEYSSDGISTSKEFVQSAPASARAIMGGQDGSILDTFGGEWEWGTAISQFTCALHENRGHDRGVSIRYGKNLLDLTQEENIQNTITGIVPFWKGQNEAQEEDYVFLEDGYLLKDGISESYPYQRLELVDLTQQFDGKPDSDELLEEAENYIDEHDIGKPSVNLTISFVALYQTEEYKNIAPLERVNLCDTVKVEFEKLGVSVSAKVVKTVYNVLLDRYDSIELGEAKGTLAKTVQQNIDAVKKDIDEAKATFATNAMVQRALDEASAKITGGLGGYVVINTNADGEPQEILVMNTPDKTTATSVMRINRNGIGFATGPNAYEGPFNSAWTIDGAFNASFISTGSLLANLITSGMISSANGKVYFDLDNNVIVCNKLQSANPLLPGEYGDHYFVGAYDIVIETTNVTDNDFTTTEQFNELMKLQIYRKARNSSSEVIARKAHGLTFELAWLTNGSAVGGTNTITSSAPINIASDSSASLIGNVTTIGRFNRPNYAGIRVSDKVRIWGDLATDKIVPASNNTNSRIDLDGNVYVSGNLYVNGQRVYP